MGMTRLLLTKIPHYKEIILMSFHCDYCGYENSEIQKGGKIEDKGIRIKLTVESQKDLNRQVVKSDHTSISIPSLDFEVPARSQKGEVTTIEGIIDRAITGLEHAHQREVEESSAIANQIEEFLKKLQALKSVAVPFVIIFEDISGECHVENPNAPLVDKQAQVVRFKRTNEQNAILGVYPDNEDNALPVDKDEFSLEQIQGQVLTFPTNCPECNSPCETNMKLTNIPHFKQVVIMATNCELCGHRTNEVKSGGGIEPLGVRIEVTVEGEDDLKRDVLKSETCHLSIPELEMEVGPAALGGRFTTVEGMIVSFKDQLSTSTALTGDTADQEVAERMENFISRLCDILNGKQAVTLVLDDPAGNSFVQSLIDEGTDDKLKITKYERTFEQNEELGLNDMKVEDY